MFQAKHYTLRSVTGIISRLIFNLFSFLESQTGAKNFNDQYNDQEIIY